MSIKIKSFLYFASFAIAIVTYYNVGQIDAQELAMAKEIAKIENQTVATPNATKLTNLQ